MTKQYLERWNIEQSLILKDFEECSIALKLGCPYLSPNSIRDLDFLSMDLKSRVSENYY